MTMLFLSMYMHSDMMSSWHGNAFYFSGLASSQKPVKWKPFLLYWTFVRRIHWSLVDTPKKGKEIFCVFIFVTLKKLLSKQSSIILLMVWDDTMLMWCYRNVGRWPTGDCYCNTVKYIIENNNPVAELYTQLGTHKNVAWSGSTIKNPVNRATKWQTCVLLKSTVHMFVIWLSS